MHKTELEIERCLEFARLIGWCSRKKSAKNPRIENLRRMNHSCKEFRYRDADMKKTNYSMDMGRWLRWLALVVNNYLAPSFGAGGWKRRWNRGEGNLTDQHMRILGVPRMSGGQELHYEPSLPGNYRWDTSQNATLKA